MLTREVTPELISAWKAVFDQYRHQLHPNKKTGAEIRAYLQQKYPITEQNDTSLHQVVLDNVLANQCHASKLPYGTTPCTNVFFIDDMGAGSTLYEHQDEIFKGIQILVGLELTTAFFMVEGSSLLWDELFAFRGLDAEDLTNYYLVAEYIACLKKFDLLDRVLV